jgi:hypothetical protein
VNEVVMSTRRMVTRRTMLSHVVMHVHHWLWRFLFQTACCTALQPSFPLRDLSVHRWFLNVALPPSSVRCSSLTQSSRSQEGWSPLPPCVSPSPHHRCTRDATPHLRRPLWCVSRAPHRISGRAGVALVSRRTLTVWVWVWVQGARRRHAHVARAGQFGSVDWLETIASLFEQPACAVHLVEYGPLWDTWATECVGDHCLPRSGFTRAPGELVPLLSLTCARLSNAAPLSLKLTAMRGGDELCRSW